MQRRMFLAGSAALLASPAMGAARALREFRIIRSDDDIGFHRLEAVQGPNGFEMVITIRIAVKILGITAYRYEMDNREVWRGRELVSLDSKVNDDGEEDFAKATRDGAALNIKGSRYEGAVTGSLATTTYYTMDFLQRRPWISTQTGAPLEIAIMPEGRANWWTVTGELDTTLGYDDRGEWVGCEFDAGGEPAFYEVAKDTGSLSALWQSS